ncbi:alpha,alpha-phosphotrehalase [Paenibacillus apiarius]|uniref:alpha,alpha-phosphotrehalase n=1 Tax=Paenibacillus apiarius TaxID=46240 RepID=UPI00234A6BF9|nr:alpha,alpha-phosphotrehalase [Paenibacillus apiarius]MEC0119935.1 alpha,alpha-phosphotrehalase [Paenibacillus apiarius]MEC0189447.1 alpha,alpha-phosphotrehalase [Paenibacillus apiarius]
MKQELEQEWWKKSVIYQIYPKSFHDTDGDGLGDLQGIIDKLDYLRELGIDVIWLTPIYESPQKDNGYDISDYYRIQPEYGTMETFEELLRAAHAKGIRIIMDIVVNHTSTEHAWFKEAAKGADSPLRNYYIWKDGVNGGAPNNWQSKFGGSAWAYDDATGQYYLHLYDVSQADLNWENPELRDRVYDMMQFWLDKGVDGFRLDVINVISKDQRFPDDSLDMPTADGRKYYTDGPRIHEFLKEMNARVFSQYSQLLTVGEMSSTTMDNCVKYTRPEERELSMVFNFHHLKVDYPQGEKWVAADFDFVGLKRIMSDWQAGMNAGGGWNALFWCNHDQPRAVSRFGDDGAYRVPSAKMLATTLHLMQGTPYVYQGEELGMTNPHFDDIADYRDVESINAYQMLRERGVPESDIMAALQQKSRDNSRTPMQWNDSEHGGFTSGMPWIQTAPNYRAIHAEEALRNPDSIFHHYRKLIELRKQYDIIVHGDYKLLLADHPQIFAYVRSCKKERLLVISNFYGHEATFTLPQEEEITGEARILLSNYADTPNTIERLVLRPYESVAFHVVNDK